MMLHVMFPAWALNRDSLRLPACSCQPHMRIGSVEFIAF